MTSRVVAFLMAGLSCASLLAGCTDQGDAVLDAIQTLQPGELRGVVIDAAVRPIPGVTLSVPGRPEVEANVTDADGAFLLTGLAPGTVIVAATKPGHLDAYVEVAVGKANALVQIVLEPLLETKPYVVLESFDGFMDCGLGSGPAFGLTAGCMVIVGGALYVACVGSDPVPPAGVCIGGTSPYYVSAAEGNMTTAQTEAVWTPTVQGQSELLIGSYVVDSQGAVVGGLPTAVGPSILVRRLNETVVQENGLGGAHRVAIFINPGNGGPANIVVQQPYRVFHTSTFFFALPEAWVFAVDGPPEVPEQCMTCLGV